MENSLLEQQKNLDIAYKILKEKIVKSNSYTKFIADNLGHLSSLEKDIDVINSYSNAIGIDKEFNEAIINGVLSDNVISNIINVKFIETLYGNPNKEDLTINDALFVILESVFELDTIINSISDENILLNKFNEVMNTKDIEESYNFINLINKIYNEAKAEKEYDKVLEIVRNYRQDLIPYVSAGINSTINDISSDNNRSFKESDVLLRQVMEVIGKSDIRKM